MLTASPILVPGDALLPQPNCGVALLPHADLQSRGLSFDPAELLPLRIRKVHVAATAEEDSVGRVEAAGTLASVTRLSLRLIPHL